VARSRQKEKGRSQWNERGATYTPWSVCCQEDFRDLAGLTSTGLRTALLNRSSEVEVDMPVDAGQNLARAIEPRSPPLPSSTNS
jgi:hypothetical protein